MVFNSLFLEYFSSIFCGILYAIACGQVFLVLIAFLGAYFVLSLDPCFKTSLTEVFLFWKNVPFLSKWPFFVFTMFVALPHRFWINNNVGLLGTVFVTLVTIFFGLIVSPFFWVILIAFLNFAATNMVFVMLHQKSSNFRGVFYFVLFGVRDHPFAPKYFSFFFGNPAGKILEKLFGSVLAVAAASNAAFYDSNNALAYGEGMGKSFEAARVSQGLSFTLEESQEVKKAASKFYKYGVSPASSIHNFVNPAEAESVLNPPKGVESVPNPPKGAESVPNPPKK